VLLPCEDRGAERRSWFVYVVQLPEGTDRDAVITELADSGVAAKPYLPCIHLMPFYRERFGFRGGEFPVAERFAKRALGLPFFTSMTERQVERVVGSLEAALGRPAG
jgi:dTDP-4-amino-4,6-dideoxygalactose transaminase